MDKAIARHCAAINAGLVDRGNVIGMRKAINAAERKRQGWSIGVTASKAEPAEVDALETLLERQRPLVAPELAVSGLKVLRNRRYAKQLASVAGIIPAIVQFRLVGFDRIGRRGEYAVPLYRAETATGTGFVFRNIPWQSGGNGPEVQL